LALFISCSDGLHIKIDPVQTNCDMQPISGGPKPYVGVYKGCW